MCFIALSFFYVPNVACFDAGTLKLTTNDKMGRFCGHGVVVKKTQIIANIIVTYSFFVCLYFAIESDKQ